MSIQTNKLPDNPQIEVVKSGKTGLFTNYIYKAIPLAFDESMSYYETLCGLLNYLQNTIIPTVNNNADAVAELQSLYEQLRSYVDNYFTNLDVQEEINNKLDQMVTDGTLPEIVASYLNSKAIFGYDNVASMKQATNLINGSYAQTLGFYNKNDGGSALYKIRQITNDDVVDEMMIISLNDDTLIAELIVENDNLNILKVGAKNDGSIDTSNIINHLITNYNNYNIYIPNGDYLINSTILIDTATKIYGENKWKTRLFTNSNIVMIQNKNDDIATCFISNLYLDGNNVATKGIYLYRNRPNLVYNDSRSDICNILIKKCTDWCMQIGDPNTASNVIEIYVNNVYVHQYTGGGIYISKCSDSHFENIRSGSGLSSTKPAIQVDGYNLQIINSKAFLSGTTDTPLSGWVFNGGANIIADIEAQANSKYGVEIINTKDSIFNIIADKNGLINQNYGGVLINSVQNCRVDANVSNNVATDQFNSVVGCKLIEPKKLILNLNCNNDIPNAIDLSEYNQNQVLTVNSEININGYKKDNIMPSLNETLSLPEGITLTKINNENYLLQGSVASDTNIWVAGSYGSHAPLTYLKDNYVYDISTSNFKVGMTLFNYVTNIGGGFNRKINGSNNEVTGFQIILKAGINYNHIISPKLIALLNTPTQSI